MCFGSNLSGLEAILTGLESPNAHSRRLLGRRLPPSPTTILMQARRWLRDQSRSRLRMFAISVLRLCRVPLTMNTRKVAHELHDRSHTKPNRRQTAISSDGHPLTTSMPLLDGARYWQSTPHNGSHHNLTAARVSRRAIFTLGVGTRQRQPSAPSSSSRNGLLRDPRADGVCADVFPRVM